MSTIDIRPQTDVKGILIGNFWLRDGPESRQDPFPPNVIEQAERLGHSLLTTQVLFGAYCKVMLGDLDTDSFIRLLFDTNGVVVFK